MTKKDDFGNWAIVGVIGAAVVGLIGAAMSQGQKPSSNNQEYTQPPPEPKSEGCGCGM